MKNIALAVLLLTSFNVANAQSYSNGFVTAPVGRSVGEYTLKVDQSTPLDLYLSTEYIATTGRQSLWKQIQSYQNRFSPATADREVSEETKQGRLGNRILEMIVYRDTVAAVLVQPAKEVFPGFPLLVQLCRLEDGRWVATGQDINTSVEAAREKFATLQAKNSLKALSVIELLKKVPQDTAPFLAHLREKGKTPGDFLLDALSKHKIVIWGEVHRRRVSWEVLKSIVHDPRFTETTGTVFMELPLHAQARMDHFFASETMDPKIVYSIFADEQPLGWFDGGEFEFIVELWKINRSLPSEKRIKVVLVDFQIPYSDILTSEEFNNYPRQEDRNTHMADVIEHTMRISNDKRNSLFVVGYLHAYSSPVPGTASTPRGMTPAPTAGAQLSGRFPDGDVFAIFQHSPRITNSGGNGGFIRDGGVDRVFAEAGNTPIGFTLADSPFGAEPFDADMDLMYNPRMGSFADNFDGYVFFGPLAEEEGDHYLYDIFDDEFVREIKRRITSFGLNEWYGGLKPDELTPRRMIDLFEKDSEGKRWAGAFEN